MLTVGSLFSGIGGLELGLERAGLGPVLWQVELDPFCREVLAAHWPGARRFHDVTALPALIRARRHRGVGPWYDALVPDVLCGGFPCQDVSLAGKGAGLSGVRSGLWYEYLRVVRLLRPRFVVVENVPGLVQRGLDVVVAGLTAAGYAVQGTRLSAADVGAPHRRERLFLVAHAIGGGLRDQQRRRRWARGAGETEPVADGAVVVDAQGERRGEGRPESATEGNAPARGPGGSALAHGHGHGREGERRGGLLDGERAPRRDDADGCGGEAVAYAGSEAGRREEGGAVAGGGAGETRLGETQPRRHGLGDWPPAPDDVLAWGGVPADAQPSLCRLADGVSARLARRRLKLKALGNAVVPECAEVVGRRVLDLLATTEAA